MGTAINSDQPICDVSGFERPVDEVSVAKHI
jgi:hypothetical protein